MAAASLDAQACADPAAHPSVPNPAVVQMFFPDQLVRPVHLNLPVLSAVAYTDDSRPARFGLVGASADLDAGHFAAAGFLALYPAPVHDFPCALALEDVVAVVAVVRAVPELRVARRLVHRAVEAVVPVELHRLDVLETVVRRVQLDAHPVAAALELRGAQRLDESLADEELVLQAVAAMAWPLVLPEVSRASQRPLKERLALAMSRRQVLQVLPLAELLQARRAPRELRQAEPQEVVRQSPKEQPQQVQSERQLGAWQVSEPREQVPERRELQADGRPLLRPLPSRHGPLLPLLPHPLRPSGAHAPFRLRPRLWNWSGSSSRLRQIPVAGQ
jgi:hypothetical protein